MMHLLNKIEESVDVEKCHEIQYNNFNPARCNICFMHPKKSLSGNVVKLRYCTKCKLIGYCSKEHQKEDWKNHKEFCTAVEKLMKGKEIEHFLNIRGESIVDSSIRDLQCVIYVFKSILESVLKRPLFPHEHLLITFPTICRNCFEFDTTRLQACKNCNQIFYCSNLHQELDAENHQKWCQQYKINFILDNKYPRLKNSLDKHEYLKLPENELESFPTDIFALANKITNKNFSKYPETVEELENFKFVASYSYVGTILYALEMTNFRDKLSEKFVIHVVGTKDEAVYFEDKLSSILFTFLENVKIIIIHFIGPQMKTLITRYSSNFQDDRVLKMEFHNEYYQNISKHKIDKPNLIISYNCGFSEFKGGEISTEDTWGPAISKMIRNTNIPIAFTSYTRNESIQDCAAVFHSAQNLMEEDFLYVIKSGENPFKDVKPLRNTEVVDKIDEIYYNNGYVTIVVSNLPGPKR